MKRKSQQMLSKKSHILIVSAIIIAFLSAGGYYYYSLSTKQLRSEKENELKAIAELKIHQLVQWHKERIAHAKVITESPFFVNGIEEWLDDRVSKPLKADILERLQSAKLNYGYENVFLVSTRGDVLLSVNQSEKMCETIILPYIYEASSNGKITFTDFYFCPLHNKIHYDIIAPIKNENNNVIADLVFRVDPYVYFYPLIQSWPTPSKSSEVFLVKKDGDSVLYLNELRHQKNTALQLRIPLTRTDLPATQAILGKTGIFDGKDYRGTDVVAWLSPVPGTDWFMVSKVDRDEIFADLYYNAILLSILISLLILSLVTGLVWIYHYRQRNIYRSLWQVQEEFRTTLYSIGDAVISTDVNGRIKNMNEAAETLTGWKEAEAIGKNSTEVFRIINEETRTKVENPVDIVLKYGKIVGLANHTVLISKNGTEYHISDSAAPIKDADGKISGVVLVFSDVSEKYNAEKGLRENEETFRRLFNESADAILLLDDAGFTDCNQAAISLFEYSTKEEIIDTKPWEVSPEKQPDGQPSKEKAEAMIAKALQQGYNIFEWVHTKSDGREFPAEVMLTPIVIKGKQTFYSVVRDISERKRAEEALSKSEDKFRNLVENITDVFYTTNSQGRFEYCSPNFFVYTGYNQNDILNKFYFSVVAPIDKRQVIAHYTASAIKGVLDTKLEFRVIRKDGTIFWAEQNTRIVFDNMGQAIQYRNVARDITERKQAEETLQRSFSLLTATLESTADGILVVDTEGKIVSFNQKFVNMWDIPDSAIASRDDNQYLAFVLDQLKNPEAFLKKVRELYAQPEAESYDMLEFKDGRVFERYSHPQKLAGTTIGRVWSFRDITERKRAEEELMESEEKYRLIVENSNEGIEISQDDKIIYSNKQFAEMLGYTVEEIVNVKFDVIHTPQALREGYDRQKRREIGEIVPNQYETTYHKKDKSIIHVKVNYEIIDFNGKPATFATIQDITEQKLAEENLKLSEHTYRGIINSITEAVYILNNKGEFLDVNDAAELMYGYPREYFVGKTPEFISAPGKNDLQKTTELIGLAFAGELQRFEFWGLRKDGSIFPKTVSLSKGTYFGEDIVIAVGRDITERKLAEEELVQSNKRLLNFFEDDITADFLSTPDGKLIFCNKTFVELFGFASKEEALEYPIEKLYCNPSNRAIYLNMLKANGKVENFECDYRSKDGRKISAIQNSSGEFNQAGELIHIKGYLIDISERKIAEEGVRKLSRAVEQSPVSIIITNPSGDIEYVNERFCIVTGYSRDEVIGNNPNILSSGLHDDKFYEDLWKTILSGKEWTGEMRNKKKNGELYWESTRISLVVNNEGDVTHFIAIKEDITEMKKMNEELLIAKELAEQSNKLKDAFIANMSHEIRTPLNGLLGMTSILKEAFAEYTTENEEACFSGIATSSNRIIRTVDMILNYSQFQAGSFVLSRKVIDINSICAALHNEFKVAASKKSLKLTFENKCKDTTIVADEFCITQSISNLIDNSIKYTNVGFVEVILYNDAKDNILLDVNDSGIGIAEDYIEHIYEPYRQEEMGYGRAYEGVGLGLSLVRNFLIFNNASISLKSKKGEGTTFTINFGLACKPGKKVQAAKSEIAEAKEIIASAPAKGDKPMVLLVEDDDLNKLTTKLYLGNKFRTIVTDSSDEVIDILKRNKVDIILMDVSIRGAKNGLELATELKGMKEFSAIPIIAVTAHAFESDRKNALAAGCDDYLSKPFTKEEILLKIAKFV